MKQTALLIRRCMVVGLYMFGFCGYLMALSGDEASAERIKDAILQVMGQNTKSRVPLRSPQRVNNEQRREKKLQALPDDNNRGMQKKCTVEVEEAQSLKCSDTCDTVCQDVDVTPEVVIGAPDDVIIGTYHNPKDLIVSGNERVGGSCAVGTFDKNSCRPGCRYIIGAVPLDPSKQQLEIQFKDKSRLLSDVVGNGAYVELEFITTGTKRLTPITDLCDTPVSSPVSNVGCRFAGLFVYPKMTEEELLVKPDGTAFVATGLPIQMNTSLLDLKLTVTTHVNAFTKNVAFGFVPVHTLGDSDLEVNGYLFYGKGPIPSAYYMNTGVLAYKVVSDNVVAVRVVGITDEVLQEDILNTLSDSELLALYKILQNWFGVDVSDNCRALELIEKNKTRLGWLLKSIPNKGLLSK